VDDDNTQLLEILETVEKLIKNNTGLWSSRQWAQSLFNKLFVLIKSDRKEVRLKLTKDNFIQLLFFSDIFCIRCPEQQSPPQLA
jgi:hypothetical protein